MKKIAVIVANGVEETETLVTVDVLRRAGVSVDIISVNSEFVEGSHGIIFKADKLDIQFDIDNYDGMVIPGGMPGAETIGGRESVVLSLKKALNDNKLVAAICAAPAVVLAENGLLSGQKVTCYPAKPFVDKIENYTGNNVEIDGNIITANGPKSALEFALKICEYLGQEPKF